MLQELSSERAILFALNSKPKPPCPPVRDAFRRPDKTTRTIQLDCTAYSLPCRDLSRPCARQCPAPPSEMPWIHLPSTEYKKYSWSLSEQGRPPLTSNYITSISSRKDIQTEKHHRSQKVLPTTNQRKLRATRTNGQPFEDRCVSTFFSI